MIHAIELKEGVPPYYIVLHNAFQIFVGQKMRENQCKVNCFEVHLSTVILHQIIATRNAYLVKTPGFAGKEQRDELSVQLVYEQEI